MSDKRERNEINESELKQVAGGRIDNMKRHYRCPVCGDEEWVTIGLSIEGSTRPFCPTCLKNGQEVKMKEIS